MKPTTILDSPNILEPRAIVGTQTDDKIIEGICGKNFFIPSYQRGYRWNELQVKQLINDLYEFFYSNHDSGDFYCLQPIVLKSITDIERKISLNLPTDETWYEVIDGQQRLTTIRIILALMQKLTQRKGGPSFRLYYETRPNLKDVFSAIEVYDIYENDEDKPESYRARFKSQYHGTDIDSWHILKAANHILDFFQNKEIPGISIDTFLGKFKECFTNTIRLDNTKSDHKSVQVLWYELKDHDQNSASALFKRLNEMCIKLNNAELIRALFLSDSAKYSVDQEITQGITDPLLLNKITTRERNRKQSHIITQWDMIEHRLREPRLWAFIYNEQNQSKYNCRIEYIFDLISKKSESDRDSLTTLLAFEAMSHKSIDGIADPLWNLWLKVEMYFATLLAWSEDRDMYHLIGYLVATNGRKALVDLLSRASEKTKKEFKEYIHTLITQTVRLPENVNDIEQLSYINSSDYKVMRQLLFLFNIESTRQSLSEPFFPFERYKESSWTLEHIHAQNSELIDQADRLKWKEFITINLTTLRNLQSRFKDTSLDSSETIELLNRHLNDMQSDTYTFMRFRQMFDTLSTYYDRLAENKAKAGQLHSISNMALLSGNVNSSIGNSVFEVKRQKIIEMDAAGEYIPLCTRKVFLKYYNTNDCDFKVSQMFFWGEQDRINYLSHLKYILSPYTVSASTSNNPR